jgi:hypothetical protein
LYHTIAFLCPLKHAVGGTRDHVCHYFSPHSRNSFVVQKRARVSRYFSFFCLFYIINEGEMTPDLTHSKGLSTRVAKHDHFLLLWKEALVFKLITLYAKLKAVP